MIEVITCSPALNQFKASDQASMFFCFSTAGGASTNQVIQKRNMKMEASGRVTDIRIENFDLSFGSKYEHFVHFLCSCDVRIFVF